MERAVDLLHQHQSIIVAKKSHFVIAHSE